MFEMSDPATALIQIRAYASEARYEMAEVMASALTQRMIADKNRDLTIQDLLVQGLRDLANILEIRGKEKAEKLKLALKASKELSKQRARLAKLQKDAGDIDSAKTTLANKADDEVQTGRVFALMGKKGKAMKKFAKANKLRKHHLEACTEAVGAEFLISGHLKKGVKHGRRLADAMTAAGAVNRTGEIFQLLPEGQRPAEVTSLISRVTPWCDANAEMPEPARNLLTQNIMDLQSQIQRIESGEQAANAALSAAVDKLNPTMDYHSFSRS